ncbi:helix-turn-helix domain-containing protein [Candidatus Burkholderia verschuerenii]|uniref:helix-turn-helix domain-containing protein n=1 Tax=Candidatus Burkholderia verschuerenii TaxID=242163 RepID=UPI0034DD2B9E
MAERFSLPQSQVSRILGSFRDAGWLEQDPRTRTYSVGGAYVFGARFVQFDPLTRQAFPVFRGVVDRSGFNATLSVLDNLKPLYLIGIAGRFRSISRRTLGRTFRSTRQPSEKCSPHMPKNRPVRKCFALFHRNA